MRRVAVDSLPPEKLLSDTQPAYVSSWIYVFGVLTLAAFVVVCASGAVIALAGPAWWHSSVGHFVNSMHLWSTELFFFFMVVHLWGKFFMAAWRGRRALTWMTGAVAFLVSIGTAFTGYLSQQNLDSQWISTQAKDGLNASGVGAFFNVLNFGQMLMWHVLLLPLIVALLIGGHILLVRRRGVCPPLPGREGRPLSCADYPARPDPNVEWSGAKRDYDLVKELVIAIAAVALLTLAFAAIFSSPDDKPVTVAGWAKADPGTSSRPRSRSSTARAASQPTGRPTRTSPAQGRTSSATSRSSERSGCKSRSTRRAPSCSGRSRSRRRPTRSSSRAHLLRGRVAHATAGLDNGVREGTGEGELRRRSSRARSGLVRAATDDDGQPARRRRSGGLDGALISTNRFYQTNFTKSLLFLADGSYLKASPSNSTCSAPSGG